MPFDEQWANPSPGERCSRGEAGEAGAYDEDRYFSFGHEQFSMFGFASVYSIQNIREGLFVWQTDAAAWARENRAAVPNPRRKCEKSKPRALDSLSARA